jgi:hypothetical protein
VVWLERDPLESSVGQIATPAGSWRRFARWPCGNELGFGNLPAHHRDLLAGVREALKVSDAMPASVGDGVDGLKVDHDPGIHGVFTSVARCSMNQSETRDSVPFSSHTTQ